MSNVTVWKYHEAPDDFDCLTNHPDTAEWIIMAPISNYGIAFTIACNLGKNTLIEQFKLGDFGRDHAVFVVYVTHGG